MQKKQQQQERLTGVEDVVDGTPSSSCSAISDDDEAVVDNAEPVGIAPRLPPTFTKTDKDKSVVYKGTYPIDRPIGALNLAQQARVISNRPTSLTLKTPRTFAIDEPIREEVRTATSGVKRPRYCLPTPLGFFFSLLHIRSVARAHHFFFSF